MEERRHPTQLERIAVLETKIESIDTRTAKMDVKLDTVVEYMTTSQARRRGIVEVFGAERAALLILMPLVSLFLAIVATAAK